MRLKKKSLKILLAMLTPVLMFIIVFVSLDQGEQPELRDVLIVPEGGSYRAYKAVDLLLEGYSNSDQIIVSPGTEHNLPNYFEAGAVKEQLHIEEEATSTWMNATNTIEIMEENGWKTAIVVTADFHIRRTRLSFERASIGKDLNFTYVSTYYRDAEGQPVAYLNHRLGREQGVRETAKYFGYVMGLYHVIDL